MQIHSGPFSHSFVSCCKLVFFAVATPAAQVVGVCVHMDICVGMCGWVSEREKNM